MAMFPWVGPNLHFVGSLAFSLLIFLANVITLLVCSFKTPTLINVSRQHPTPFTPNASVMGLYVAFMYIVPFIAFIYYSLNFPQNYKHPVTDGPGYAILFSMVGSTLWIVLWVKEQFEVATAIQLLVLLSLLYTNIAILRLKPSGPLQAGAIVHIPVRFFLVLSLNVLVGASLYAAIARQGPQPLPPPNPSPTTSVTSLSTTYIPSTTFSEPITVTFSESKTEELPGPTTTVESQTVGPVPTTTVEDTTTAEASTTAEVSTTAEAPTTTGEDTPTTTTEGDNPTTTLEPTTTTTEEESPTTTSEPIETTTGENHPTTTEEDIPTTTTAEDKPTTIYVPTETTTVEQPTTTDDVPTMTKGPITIEPTPITTDEPATTTASTTEEEEPTTTADEHPTATPINAQQSVLRFKSRRDAKGEPETPNSRPAIIFLVVVNILELFVHFWLEDSSLCAAATWAAIGLWASGAANSAVKEASTIGMAFAFFHPLAFGLSTFIRRRKKRLIIKGPERPLNV